MESLKEKLPMIIAIIAVIAICGVAVYFMEFHQEVYYTQIDNTKIEKLSISDDMKYKYTLDCYNENGKKKEIKSSCWQQAFGFIRLSVNTKKQNRNMNSCKNM